MSKVRINQGSGTKVTINKPGQPGNVHIVGGGSTPPEPPSLPSGAWAHFDAADAGNTVTTGAMQTLLDLTGNSRSVTQGTAANRPVYTASGGANNLPYISFDATDELALTGLSLVAPYTVFMVVKPPATVVTNRGYFRTNATSILRGTKESNGQNAMQLYINGPLSKETHNAGWNEWMVIAAKHKSSAGYLRVNKDPVMDNAAVTYADLDRIQLGISGSTQAHDMAEFLIYDGDISQATEDQVIDFLINKYAIVSRELLLTFGDSITLGQNANPQEWLCWASLMAFTKGLNIYNYGVGSTIVQAWSTATGIPGSNFDSTYLSGDIVDTSGWVTIAYGTNDAGPSAGRTADATWKAQYKALIESLIAFGHDPAKIILCTPPYQSIRPTMPSFNTLIEEIADELGLVFADVYDYTQANGGDTLLSDGIHPSTAGHAVMATYLETFIP